MTLCVGPHPDDPPEADDPRFLCGVCFSRLRSSLLELPAVAGWLHVFIAAGGPAGERVSGTREDPIPLRTDVLDLIGPVAPNPTRSLFAEIGRGPLFLLWEDGVVVGVFTTWREARDGQRAEMRAAGVPESVVDILTHPHSREDIRERAADVDEAVRHRWQIRATAAASDQSGETSMFDELRSWAALAEAEATEAGEMFPWEDRRTLTGAVGYLTGHLSWVAAQPWVDELVAVVRKMHADAHRLAPWRAQTRRDPTPCETCGARAILIHLAEGRSRCEKNRGGCGRVIVWSTKHDERKTG